MPTREKRLRMEQNKRRREQAAQQSPPPVVESAALLPTTDAHEEESVMASVSEAPTWWTRFTIPGLSYFTYRGTNYDRGQLLELLGGPRDEQLERMGYVQRASKDEARLQAQCGVCGGWFLTEQFRDAHGRLRHSNRFTPELDMAQGMLGPDGGAAVRDLTGDADERRMQQQYPLYLERTRATLESGPA